MGRFSDVLFTADYDRTLSDHRDAVPQSNIDAIREFMAEGGLFCLNSGRSIPMLRPKAALVPTNAPCLCYNGAACYDFAADRLLGAAPLPDSAQSLLDELMRLDIPFGIEVQRLDSHYSLRASARDRLLTWQGITPRAGEDGVPLPWMKIVLCITERDNVLSSHVTPEQSALMDRLQAEAERICGETCYVVRSLPLLLEIGTRGCDKGSAARKLAEALGRRVLVCAGDAPNDRQMLEAADYAFVPRDGNEQMRALPGVRITAPSDAGCIADAVRMLTERMR